MEILQVTTDVNIHLKCQKKNCHIQSALKTDYDIILTSSGKDVNSCSVILKYARSEIKCLHLLLSLYSNINCSVLFT